MYLSRIQLRFDQLRPDMLEKWHATTSYASHQWLWQLFPGQQTRQFLFRQEAQGGFFVLSATAPATDHNLFNVETRAFKPQLAVGALLDFQLRANPVITRGGKRSDVMMDAKYQAKKQDVPQAQWWEYQQNAAKNWLRTQGEKHGFQLITSDDDMFSSWAGEDEGEEKPRVSANVVAYTQHRLIRKAEDKPIVFSSVDFTGTLRVTDPEAFATVLYHGLGKSKALGCGLMMVKRSR